VCTENLVRSARLPAVNQVLPARDVRGRDECVDYLIVLGEAHLRRILRAYAPLLQ
jgi:hypothetical protein